jgi:tetratricopeptide (TPR) repeat protein
MGYPDLYMGEYKEAEKHAMHTLDSCKEAKHYEASYWKGLSFDILGKIALVKGLYEEAENYFQESLQIFQTYASEEKICGILACLGLISRVRNQPSRAQELLYRALEKSIEMTAIFELGHAITGVSLLLADLGEEERAVKYYASAATMGVVDNSRWFADIAGDEMAAFEMGMPTEIVAAAKGRAQTIDSWETAEKLLAELGELEWGDSVSCVD